MASISDLANYIRPPDDPPITLDRAARDLGIGVDETVTVDPEALFGYGQAATNLLSRGTSTGATLNDEGFQALQDDKQRFSQAYWDSHVRNGTDEDLAQRYAAYQNTPQYMQFLGKQPTVSGLSLAAHVHKTVKEGFGLDGDESLGDTMLQGLGNVLVPNPIEGGAVVKTGLDALNAPKMVAKVVAPAADFVTGMGTDLSHYTPVGVGTNALVGAGLTTALDASQRPAQADQPQQQPQPAVAPPPPTYEKSIPAPPSLAGLASTMQGQPIDIQAPPPPNPSVVQQLNPIGEAEAAQPVSDAADPTSQTTAQMLGGVGSHGIVGTVAAGLGAILVGSAAGRAIRRIREPVNNVNFEHVIQPGPTQPEAQAAARTAAGFAQDNLGGTNPIDSASRYIGASTDQYAPVAQLANDLGGLPAKQTVDGAIASGFTPTAQRQAVETFVRHGELPDGTVAPMGLDDYMQAVQQANPDDVAQASDYIIARNVTDNRREAFNSVQQQLQAAQTALTSRPNDPDLIAQIHNLQSQVRGHLSDNPAFRGTHFPNMTNFVAAHLQNDAGLTAGALEIVQARRGMMLALNRMEHRSGLIDMNRLVDYNQNPDYSPLFEFQGNNLISQMERDQSLVTPPATHQVNATMDPWQALAYTSKQRIERAQKNIGNRALLNVLQPLDPTGHELRIYSPNDPVPFGGRGVVDVWYGGREHHAQFARTAVADAINAEGAGYPSFMRPINQLRRAQQFLITGPFTGAHATAFKSALFDIPSINATHVEGSAFGVGSLALQVAAHAFAPNSRFLQRVAHTLGHNVLALPDQYASSVFMGLHNIALSGAITTARSIQRQLLNGSGWFAHAVQTIPGADRALLSASDAVARYYGNSVLGMLHHNNLGAIHQMMIDTTGVRNTYEKFARKYMNGGQPKTATGQAVSAALKGYMSILNNIHLAPATAYMAQTRVLQQFVRGRPLTGAERRTLATAGEQSMGNLGAMPGNTQLGRLLKGPAAGMPYFNISMQGMRHVIKSAFGQGAYQSANTFLGLGTLAAAMYMKYKMFQQMGPEAEDYYWNKMSAYDRISQLAFPRAETFETLFGGGQLKFDPANPLANFHTFRMAPEVGLIPAMFMSAAEKLGAVQRPVSNSPTGAPGGDILTALTKASGLGSPAVTNTLLGLTGNNAQVDWSQLGNARGVVSDPNPRTNRSLGLLQGATINGMPNALDTILKHAFGLAGATASQLIDDGLGSYTEGESFAKYLQRGKGDIENQFTHSMPDVPMLWNADTKITKSSPETETIGQYKQAMMFIKDQIAVDFGKQMAGYNASPSLRANPIALPLAVVSNQIYHNFIKWPTQGVRQAQQNLDNFDNARRIQDPNYPSSKDYQTTRNQLLSSLQNANGKLFEAIQTANGIIGKNERFADALKQAGQPANMLGVAAYLRTIVGDRPNAGQGVPGVEPPTPPTQ